MNLRVGVSLLGAASLCACTTMAPLTQTDNNVNKFAAGIHTVDSAEMAFLRQVQSAECSSRFYSAAFTFATASKDPRTKQYPNVPFDLHPDCEPQELTNDELRLRQTLLDTLAAYGDSMQFLLTGNNNGTPDSWSDAVAKDAENLAKQEKFKSISSSDAAGMNAAVVSIAEVILDHHEYANVKQAAAKAEPSLEIMVNTLKSENTNDAEGIKSKLTGIKQDLYIAARASREQRGAASLFDIASAHAALEPLSVATDVTLLNATLDAMVSSNKALASDDQSALLPEVINFVSQGQKAAALYNASK